MFCNTFKEQPIAYPIVRSILHLLAQSIIPIKPPNVTVINI